MDLLPLAAQAASSTTQNVISTVVMGIIMFGGTALLMWLILRFDRRSSK